MKILITKQTDPKTKKSMLINQQVLPEETKNIKHELVELEPLPPKDSFHVTYEYDNDSQKVVGKYVEIPKSETQQLKEDLEQTKIALAEMTALLSTVVTPPNVG